MSLMVTIVSDCIGGALGIVKHVPSPEELKQRIESALPGSEVTVEDLTGGGDHFRAEVISDRFAGLSRIDQHKLVYEVFGDEMGGPIHALSIKTSTPNGGQP
jgi:stress-induced morphogen